ncbi:uncharacterized protein LAJ45_03445 [Morchella importuna]|uniref:uncharacterized protein n=1 Tax=Morchella importuna TaxID=1174673 RepID=UPI001E8DE3D3|nr:uncharacterized protein LAJ45_03445 [Morchella importuna]KAH8152604.1 hypothetical protein LAJ45_03445 [Morchella importuna]
MSNITSLHNHRSPYYPQDLRLPHYVPNTLTTPELISRFAAYCVMIVIGTIILLGAVARKRLTTYEKIVATWFMLCGFIHLFFEGYFGYTASRIAGNTHLFAQLWKEYALSDSRYMSYDAFTVAMERVTAIFWGPLSFYLVYAIAVSHPARYPLQIVVSLGQLYGDVLYYATASIEMYGTVRPEKYYFWAYFFFANFFWIVIPSALLVQGFLETMNVFAKEGEKTKRK